MKLLSYIQNLVPPMRNPSRDAKKVNMFSSRIDCFKIVAFPYLLLNGINWVLASKILVLKVHLIKLY